MKSDPIEMFVYYIQLGVRSLRRMPMVTLLMVLAIGFGVAASMTSYAVFRAVSGNPIPWKSSQLFAPQIDNWDPRTLGPTAEPPDIMDYDDAMALMNARNAPRQTATYPVAFSVIPNGVVSKPFNISGYATYADFFPMFDVPFLYGGGWSGTEDQSRASSIVISSKLNDTMFGGTNSVGREIVLNDHAFRIIGVLKNWNPKPRFYDAANTNGFGSAGPDFFIPFTRAMDLHLPTKGANACNGQGGVGWDGWLHSQCVWISFWVQLPDADAVQRYHSFLEGYSAQQQRAGRFNWPPNVRLRNLVQWLDFEKIVPPETKVSLLVSFAFLVVCLVNTIGLLLAKFMRRASEVGLRRALGASRGDIYIQFLAEAAIVGIAGGLVGLLFTGLGMGYLGHIFEPDIAELAQMNVGLVLLTLLVAIVATIIAAFYPTWRAAHVQPAWQLKSN
jgi:putative ABC transport system permease protein